MLLRLPTLSLCTKWRCWIKKILIVHNWLTDLGFAEVSDQNFVEEDFDSTSLSRSHKKRPRAAAADVSSRDQVMHTIFYFLLISSYIIIAKEDLTPKWVFGESYFHWFEVFFMLFCLLNLLWQRVPMDATSRRKMNIAVTSNLRTWPTLHCQNMGYLHLKTGN